MAQTGRHLAAAFDALLDILQLQDRQQLASSTSSDMPGTQSIARDLLQGVPEEYANLAGR